MTLIEAIKSAESIENVTVEFSTVGQLVYGDIFVTDIEDIEDKEEYDLFLSWFWDGSPVIAPYMKGNEFVRAFPAGLTKDTKIIKIKAVNV
jgi:hypothetical protein